MSDLSIHGPGRSADGSCARRSAADPAARCLVLALGNVLRGDDGVGPAVLAAVGSRDLPGSVDLVDGGTPGLETALLMEGYNRVIIIDAAEMGLAPGAWRRFGPGVIRSGDLHQIGTVHAAGLGEALALGRALNLLPGDITLYGVQPADTGWHDTLSNAVSAVVEMVADAILRDVAGSYHSQPPDH